MVVVEKQGLDQDSLNRAREIESVLTLAGEHTYNDLVNMGEDSDRNTMHFEGPIYSVVHPGGSDGDERLGMYTAYHCDGAACFTLDPLHGPDKEEHRYDHAQKTKMALDSES
eukprot:Selendium_serpulae@DN11623_c0_g1_i1.p1